MIVNRATALIRAASNCIVNASRTTSIAVASAGAHAVTITSSMNKNVFLQKSRSSYETPLHLDLKYRVLKEWVRMKVI